MSGDGEGEELEEASVATWVVRLRERVAQLRRDLDSERVHRHALEGKVGALQRFQAWLMGGAAALGGLAVALIDYLRTVPKH